VIVTVTLNPALLVRYQTPQVRLGVRNQVSQVRYQAGGRGLTVARVLHTFGHEVVAAGLAGGASGEVIREELSRDGVPAAFTPIAGDSRRVLELADESAAQITSFGEPAPYITTEELGRLARDYRSMLSGASAVVLCGGLPAGLPPEIYGSLASYAADAGVPVILDAGGSVLWHGVRRRPVLVIPEAEDQPPDPRQLVAAGAGAVAVPAGEQVSVVTQQQEWRAWLTGDNSVDLSRSRDALVAGLVPGIALGWSWPDILRHAVALAVSAGQAGDVDLEAYEALVPKVTVLEPGES
jgi:tagatose 6-phosphate kinase